MHVQLAHCEHSPASHCAHGHLHVQCSPPAAVAADDAAAAARDDAEDDDVHAAPRPTHTPPGFATLPVCDTTLCDALPTLCDALPL